MASVIVVPLAGRHADGGRWGRCTGSRTRAGWESCP